MGGQEWGLAVELVIVVGFVVWMLFGFWGGSLAVSKGRSRAIGALLGLALGIFGILLVALFPTNRRALFEREEVWRTEPEQPKPADPNSISWLGMGKSPPFRW